ncbi:nucleoside deaminase [Natrarchaeobius chitinivorans]|nr:nucleoside deaminase [Natrarchaeobius chitinivorans]
MAEREELIQRTYELAEQAAENGDFPFGALIAVDGDVVETSANTVDSDRDVTAHPELKLARWAARSLEPAELDQAILYASTEPCPMCAGAIYWSGIAKVVYGVSAEEADVSGTGMVPSMSCREVVDSGSIDVEVEGPTLEDDGREIHSRFWSKPLPDDSFTAQLHGSE